MTAVCIALSCLILAACPPPGPITRGDGDVPRQHLWALLTEMDGEEQGYGMYTYVLFNRRLDVPDIDEETLSRYRSLLKALAGSTLGKKEAGELSREEMGDTNLFYVPSVVEGKKPSIEIYNTVLSMRYLMMGSRLVRDDNPEVADRLTTRPGPFLLSSLKPMGKIGSSHTPLLYADLSITNSAAMPEVVSAYKRRISRSEVGETERFAPVRLALLNLVLNADDNVRVVRAAMKEWIP